MLIRNVEPDHSEGGNHHTHLEAFALAGQGDLLDGAFAFAAFAEVGAAVDTQQDNLPVQCVHVEDCSRVEGREDALEDERNFEAVGGRGDGLRALDLLVRVEEVGVDVGIVVEEVHQKDAVDSGEEVHRRDVVDWEVEVHLEDVVG